MTVPSTHRRPNAAVLIGSVRGISSRIRRRRRRMAWASPQPSGEVEPYESVPVQPVDPQQAWADALAATRPFPRRQGDVDAAGRLADVGGEQESAVALAFCIGNFPQMVRNLHPLLAGGDLTAIAARAGRATTAPTVLEWSRTCGDGPLVTVGGWRFAVGRPVRCGRRLIAALAAVGRMASRPRQRRGGVGLASRSGRRSRGAMAESSRKVCRSCSIAAWPLSFWETPPQPRQR